MYIHVYTYVYIYIYIHTYIVYIHIYNVYHSVTLCHIDYDRLCHQYRIALSYSVALVDAQGRSAFQATVRGSQRRGLQQSLQSINT